MRTFSATSFFFELAEAAAVSPFFFDACVVVVVGAVAAVVVAGGGIDPRSFSFVSSLLTACTVLAGDADLRCGFSTGDIECACSPDTPREAPAADEREYPQPPPPPGPPPPPPPTGVCPAAEPLL